jgi:superfamily II DNA helicase RecQ
VDGAQFERLRAWRLEQAEGKPAFTVAADAVLEDVLRARPRTNAELIEIRGIGAAFCEKHGDSLLELLDELGAGARASGAEASARGEDAPRLDLARSR